MRSYLDTRSGEAGFSLMEAIVAVAILGVASVPLLVLQSQNARSVIRLENSASAMGKLDGNASKARFQSAKRPPA